MPVCCCLLLSSVQLELCIIGLTSLINVNWKCNAKQFIMQRSQPVRQCNLLTTAVLYLILLGNHIALLVRIMIPPSSVYVDLADRLHTILL